MVTPAKKRAPKKRPYTGDYLTQPYAGANYTLQFRVPEHLVGTPPFGNKIVFKKSLGTKDRREALRKRDEFLKSVGFGEPAEERQRARAERSMRPENHYFAALNSVDRSSGDAALMMLADEVSGQLHDEEISDRLREKLEAQRAAIWRLIEDPTGNSELPHEYSLTLGEAVNRLTQEMEKTAKKPKTIAKVHTAFNRYKKYNNGADDPLPAISKPKVRRYWLKLRDEKLAKGTVNTDLGFLGSAFQLAQEEGFVPAAAPNPFRDHKLQGFEAAESRRIFTENEIGALVSYVQEIGDTDVLAAMVIGYYSGMRISELFAATLVEKDGLMVWSVESAKKKKRTIRLVPIQRTQMEALIKLGHWPEAGSRAAFKTSSADALGKRFGRYKRIVLKQLGVKDEATAVFHSFRHGFITALVTAGYHTVQIADLVGHEKSSESTETARTYSQVQPLSKLAEMTNKIPMVQFAK